MKRINTLFVALFAFTSCLVSNGQDYVTTQADVAKAEEVMAVLHNAEVDATAAGKPLTVPELMVMAAKELMGTSYVGGTLEADLVYLILIIP